MRSTICASGRASAASGSTTGARDAPIRAIAFEPPRAAGRARRAGRRPGPSRASAGPAAAVALPVAGLSVRPVARLVIIGPGRAAARRADGPPGRLRRRRGAAARGDHPGHRRLDRGRARGKPLRPLGESGEERDARPARGGAARCAAPAPAMAVARVQALVEQDIADLVPALESARRRALARRRRSMLAKRGEEEAQIAGRAAGAAARAHRQGRRRVRSPISCCCRASPTTSGASSAADRRHWHERLARLEKEIDERARAHPRRLRRGAHRLEPVGLVYLWPATG